MSEIHFEPTPPEAWRTINGATNLRKNLRDGGYDVRPTVTGGKEVLLPGWTGDFPLEDPIIKSWERSEWLGTSSLTRYTPALDFDFDDEEVCKKAVRLFLETLQSSGTIIIRTGQPPRKVILCRTDAPFKKLKITFHKPGDPDDVTHAFECLGDGQQVVLFGDRHDLGTDRRYTWEGGEPGSGPGRVSRDL